MITSENKGSKVWCMKVSPRNGDNDFNSRNAEIYCFNNDIIGLGWFVDESANHSIDAVKELIRKRQKALEKPKDFDGWQSKVIPFLEQMQIGHFVWVYSSVDKKKKDPNLEEPEGYYLCKVDSDWNQNTDSENKKRDIAWFRKAKWKPIKFDYVPSYIIRNPFITTLSHVAEANGDARMENYLYDNEIPELNIQILKKNIENTHPETLALHLDQFACENIVCNYIQKDGWRLIKSTASSSLPTFECLLRRNDSQQTAFVQVKSGGQKMSKGDRAAVKNERDKGNRIYLFIANKKLRDDIKLDIPESDNVIYIEYEDIKKYLLEEKNLKEQHIPDLIRLHIELRSMQK